MLGRLWRAGAWREPPGQDCAEARKTGVIPLVRDAHESFAAFASPRHHASAAAVTTDATLNAAVNPPAPGRGGAEVAMR